MGVCTEERPVMHWQQSARFLGPGAKEKSPTPPVVHQGSSHCDGATGVINNRLLYRSCSSCPNICDHSTKPIGGITSYSESFKSYESVDSTSFESSIKYSISRSRTDCTEISGDDNNSGISLKTEPNGSPSSPESTSETNIPRGPEDCAGCGRFIQDRFYLSAVDKRWHVNCLQCYACRQPLDRESTCYSRDGNIYCKNDYYNFFGTRRCSRCLASISSTELVMRARNLVFHVSCFCCAVCRMPLTKGDQYGIIDAVIYCRTHYSIAREADAETQSHVVNVTGRGGIVGGNSVNSVVSGSGGGGGSSVGSIAVGSNINSAAAAAAAVAAAAAAAGGTYPYATQYCSPQTNDSSSPHSNPNRIVPSGIFLPVSHVISGLTQPPRQKGRPRKRKPKDIEALTVNMDLNTEYLDFGRGSHMGSSSRTKRMRTSFKHHQLRTMKSYFSVNHNPDAKDLKQLSQKTGLPKRVLQVWFQNARAKWRRLMTKDGRVLEKGDDLDSSPTLFIMGGGAKDSPPSTLIEKDYEEMQLQQ